VHSAWPWLAVAGLGALHGLNPASGWIFVAAGGWRTGRRTRALRGLVPIALGHAASVIAIAAAVPAALQRGFAVDPSLLALLAGAVLLGLVVHHVVQYAAHEACSRGSDTQLALWSFAMTTAHGVGFMLVPSLVSFCGSGVPAREITSSGSMLMALAALGIHLGSMLAVMALMAAGAVRGFGWFQRWRSSGFLR
jgi:hypothetical protein